MPDAELQPFTGRLRSFLQWFDGHACHRDAARVDNERVDPVRLTMFIVMHLACLAVIWVGWSATAVLVAFGLYFVRMFVITAFYHRYFSHRTFKTSRVFQFIMAIIGCTAAQRGPMWWAGHHRFHHNHSDEEVDRHSPGWHGFLWSHMLWFLTKSGTATPMEKVRDWRKFPEIVFVDRFDWIFVLGFAGLLWTVGATLAHFAPQLHTTGGQLLVWGFFISTVVLYHATYTINSIAHQFGSRRFNTGDDSRNNIWLAIVTLGEGWHNNHHYYPASLRQGFYWWEIDLTFYMIWLFKQVGLVWDLRPVPQAILQNPGNPLSPESSLP